MKCKEIQEHHRQVIGIVMKSSNWVQRRSKNERFPKKDELGSKGTTLWNYPIFPGKKNWLAQRSHRVHQLYKTYKFPIKHIVLQDWIPQNSFIWKARKNNFFKPTASRGGSTQYKYRFPHFIRQMQKKYIYTDYTQINRSKVRRNEWMNHLEGSFAVMASKTSLVIYFAISLKLIHQINSLITG